ncbi:MAG TPA: hypothetical protein VNO81_07620, partial [Candidatus Nitrosotenuis sp.]|nr:hypothetical protein [Candidatus Nitrosotenuis sp.]
MAGLEGFLVVIGLGAPAAMMTPALGTTLGRPLLSALGRPLVPALGRPLVAALGSALLLEDLGLVTGLEATLLAGPDIRRQRLVSGLTRALASLALLRRSVLLVAPGRAELLVTPLPGRAELLVAPLPGRAELLVAPLPGRAELLVAPLPGRAELLVAPLPGRAELLV